jgi:hypothetical protein
MIVGIGPSNNEKKRTIQAINIHYHRGSSRKNWNSYLLRYDRSVAYQEWWQQPNGATCLQARLKQVAYASWRQVGQETHDRHQKQLNRFRHRPLVYL